MFICTVVPISDDGGYRSYLGYMTFLTALWWVAAAGLTCRIEARRDSLDVVNLFTVTRIPVEAITAVEGRNGILIRTSTGHRYGSFAYGSSALQRWFPSRRHRDVAARIEDWSRAAVQAGAGRQGAAVERGPAAAGIGGRHRSTEVASRRVRRLLVVGLPWVLVMTQLYGVFLWAFADTLRPIVEGI